MTDNTEIQLLSEVALWAKRFLRNPNDADYRMGLTVAIVNYETYSQYVDA